MNKEKEIAEMAEIVKPFITVLCEEDTIAEALATAGYGNVEKAVKEFSERIEKKAQDLNGDSWDEYNEGFKRGVEEILFLMYDLITELYGGENA